MLHIPNRFAVLLVLLLPLVAGAAEPGSWRISGKVVDARSGQAVARCEVAIHPTHQRDASLSIMTGDDGHFIFDQLALGKYELTAARRGYLSQSYQQHETFTTAIAVGEDLQSEGLVFQLMPQAILFGVVTDEAGEPVRKARVRLFEDRERNGVRETQPRQTVVADDRGMYEVPNISPGNYYLAVSAQPWYANGVGPMMAGFPAESESLLDVAYPTTYYPNATDSDEATPIPVKGGERMEINMTLNPQHAMHFHLALSSTEGAGYNVSIRQSVFGVMESVSVAMQQTGNGGIEIEGLLPGHYDFTVNQFSQDHPVPAETHFTADVASGETELRQQTVVDEVTVSGTVSALETKNQSAAIGLVSLRPRRTFRAQLDAAGAFSMVVPPGDYEVRGFIPKTYLAAISSPNAEVKGRMLTVKAGTAPKLQIAAATGFGQIDGLAEAAGHSASGVMVMLVPGDAKDNHVLFRRDQSNSDGTFTLLNVIPGRYRLLAIDGGWDLEWMAPQVLNAYLKKSIAIQVQANDKLQQTVEVQQR